MYRWIHVVQTHYSRINSIKGKGGVAETVQVFRNGFLSWKHHRHNLEQIVSPFRLSLLCRVMVLHEIISLLPGAGFRLPWMSCTPSMSCCISPIYNDHSFTLGKCLIEFFMQSAILKNEECTTWTYAVMSSPSGQRICLLAACDKSRGFPHFRTSFCGVLH